jgi:hypothetical protein
VFTDNEKLKEDIQNRDRMKTSERGNYAAGAGEIFVFRIGLSQRSSACPELLWESSGSPLCLHTPYMLAN